MIVVHKPMICYRLRRIFVWTRTFIGDNCIQSPNVYRFINDVASNRTPFYAYHDLHDILNAMPRSDRKIAKFLLRLANYMQAEHATLPRNMVHYTPFIERGCLKTTVIITDPFPLGLCTFENSYKNITALIQPKIYSATPALQAWRNLSARPEATLTFDLGYAGVILTIPNYPKQHYIIIKT